MEVVQIVWLVLLVGLIVLEALTVTIVSIWFAGGALVALLIAAFFPKAVFVQVLAFVVVSALLLLALRPLVRKFSDRQSVPTNADANIGKMAQVVTEVQPGRTGRVKLDGLEWAARSDVLLPVGSWCRVNAIEGVKLIVSPVQPA